MTTYRYRAPEIRAQIDIAVAYIREASKLLTSAGAARAAAKARRALKSAEGAKRHADRSYADDPR